MKNPRRRLLVNVVTGGTIVAIAAILWWLPRAATTRDPANEGDPTRSMEDPVSGLHRAGPGYGPTALPSAPDLATPAPAISTGPPAGQTLKTSDVTRLMSEWRLAIEKRNPEVVEALDQAFSERRQELIPALMASAETDPEERVRAFSTRVLGKLRSVESQPLLRRLLDDRSEFVRFNAAWALGQLQDREAAAKLRRLEKHDRSKMVRQAANASLERMKGG